MDIFRNIFLEDWFLYQSVVPVGWFHCNKPSYFQARGGLPASSPEEFSHLGVSKGSLQGFWYLVGLDKHVDYTWCSVAPVDEQVSGVTDTRRVIPRWELELAHVVHAGLDCVVQLYLAHSKARLGERKHLNQGALPFCLSLRDPRSAQKVETKSTMATFPLAPCKLNNFFGSVFHTSQLLTQPLAALPFGRDLLPVLPLHPRNKDCP